TPLSTRCLHTFSPFLFHPRVPPLTYPLSLHDALPISYFHSSSIGWSSGRSSRKVTWVPGMRKAVASSIGSRSLFVQTTDSNNGRSEEHTSELQSRFDLVCRLLLEKKKR